MPLFRKLIRCKCCFCMKLRTGCIVISFYTLFFGFINAGTIVDDVIYKKTGRTEKAIKWFNVIHIGMMILGAVVLLIAVLSKFMKLAILWIIIFIIHILGYYIVFHVLPYGRNPLFSSALFISIYVLAMLITLALDLYCILIVCFHYYVTTHPDEFRPTCVDK